MNSSNPIGVFDSGIGGLSVLKQLVKLMPNEKFVYLGDTGRVPYGNKSADTVKRYSSECTDFLLKHDVKLVVVACNTASAIALDTVKEAAGGIPVIGMINPAAESAVESCKNNKIGVIGTRATIGSNAYQNEIKALDPDNSIEVHTKACPLFVPLVEEGLIEYDATRIIAEDYLSILKNQDIDTLVLGCTHYPLLKNLFANILPEVKLIDSGKEASHCAKRLLENADLLVQTSKESDSPNIDFYVTDLPLLFKEIAERFLGFATNSPTVTNIGTM